MAKQPPAIKPDSDTPLPIRMLEAAKPLTRAAKRSGIGKSDIVRMAVVAFLAAHPTPESVIEAKIRYQTSLHA